MILLLVCSAAHAQSGMNVNLEAWGNLRIVAGAQGFDAGTNGGGLSAGISIPLKKLLSADVSGEIGAAGIGNYVVLRAGASRPVEIDNTRLLYSPGFSLLQGMALYRPNAMYMWGIEQTNILDLKTRAASGVGLVVAFRYYGFPAYAEISRIRSFFDIRMGLRYRF
jgi:hypothetical protein